VVVGGDAAALLADDAFRTAWARLWTSCPWATPFQGPDFARAWYASYLPDFAPVLVVSRRPDGGLSGLLPLAMATGPATEGSARLVVGGGWQAEYHGWICGPEQAGAFPRAALGAVRATFPAATLRFRYLPPGTPLDGLRGLGFLLRTHRRPLLRFGDGSHLEAALRKGSNRSRLRRLEKVGPVHLRRLTSAAELDAVLDEIVLYHDTRQLAAYGGTAFGGDPHKRAFHLAMADRPGLLHMTVLDVGGRVAAAHLGADSGAEVHLGLLAHDPWLARHSPGKFLIYYLAKLLHEQGYHQLDLTPGRDPYKPRFANDADEVVSLEVLPGSPVRRAIVLAGKAVGKLRRGGRPASGPQPDDRAAPSEIWVRPPGPLPPTEPAGSPAEVRIDRLADLLEYAPAPGDPPAPEFMSAALHRIGLGERFYTRTAGGRLLEAAWIAGPAPDGRGGAPGPDAAPAALVHGLYSAGGSLDALLRRVVRDAVDTEPALRIVAEVGADDPVARRAVRAAGFARVPAPSGDVRPEP